MNRFGYGLRKLHEKLNEWSAIEVRYRNLEHQRFLELEAEVPEVIISEDPLFVEYSEQHEFARKQTKELERIYDCIEDGEELVAIGDRLAVSVFYEANVSRTRSQRAYQPAELLGIPSRRERESEHNRRLDYQRIYRPFNLDALDGHLPV